MRNARSRRSSEYRYVPNIADDTIKIVVVAIIVESYHKRDVLDRSILWINRQCALIICAIENYSTHFSLAIYVGVINQLNFFDLQFAI